MQSKHKEHNTKEKYKTTPDIDSLD